LTNVGGGRKLETVGVASRTIGKVGVNSTLKVGAGDASGIKGVMVAKAPVSGVNTGSGVNVTMLSSGVSIAD
jgi:hypothetical protein